jgi:hypothetical protein
MLTQIWEKQIVTFLVGAILHDPLLHEVEEQPDIPAYEFDVKLGR